MGAGEVVLHNTLKAVLTLVALFSMANPARADAEECGTIIVPTGIGISLGDDITGFNSLLATSVYNSAAAGLMYEPLVWINRNTS